MGDDLEGRFVTPFDTGMGYLVKFNHDFIGREALERVAQNPPRTVCTLEWDAEAVGRTFAMLFDGGGAVDDISQPSGCAVLEQMRKKCFVFTADKVLNSEGEQVGIASGRIRSFNYGRMISLGFIEPAYVEDGAELTVLWGTPGTRQSKIRVKVARFPYNKDDIVRNEDLDVAAIPALGSGRTVEQAGTDGAVADWGELYDQIG